MVEESEKCIDISNRLHNHQTINAITRKLNEKIFNSLDNYLIASYDHEKDLFVSKFKVLEYRIADEPIDTVEELKQKRISYIGHQLMIGKS